MYLSRVEIDKNNRQKIKDLSHLGAFHNWVEQSFPSEIKANNRTRKLWRIDKLNGKDYLLIVSPNKPKIDMLERYGVIGSGQCKEYSKFLSEIEDGMEARFRVILNPVVSISDRSRARGRVVPHVTAGQQLKFLKDRSVKNGFSLIEGEYFIQERNYEPLKQSNKKNINIIKVSYEGILTIENRDQMIETLTKGIGKKKAYGCGMMTIIPKE